MTESKIQNTDYKIEKAQIHPLSSILYLLLSIAFTLVYPGCATTKNTSDSIQTSSDPLQTDDPNTIDDDFALLEDNLIEEKIEIPDPLEPVNRIMFGFNDILYFWVAKPVLGVYNGVMPEPARVGIRNFFNNLSTPVRLVNCLLQGKNDGAKTELHRFAINTTAGILGFGDPALDQHGLKPVKEDLGQTLAVYGLGDGFYLVWPFFGPSTARDSVGMAGDQFLNPVRYVDPREVSIGMSIVRGVNAGSFEIGTYEEFKEAAFEPYIALREMYIQYRHKQIEE
ncbi:MAG: VacJ family lipoprotein [Sedimentisphaerales bacterium]|nr:VacJ family lipoprotein [Sedimentisphaerales bacterium]